MGQTMTGRDKFAAAFGFISDNAKDGRRQEVLNVLTALDAAIANLPPTTPAKAVEYQTAAASRLRGELALAQYNPLANKPAYKLCDAVEKKAAKVSKAVAALAESEQRIPALMQRSDNNDLAGIDAIVARIGDTAKTAREQGILIAAIRARFKIDSLSGDLSSGALPRLYKVMLLVPEKHLRNNPTLTKIERTKGNATSDYGNSTISINAGPGTSGKQLRDEPDDSAGNKLDLPHFDATTLHEIGHSVDISSNFMGMRRGDVDFGGWEESNRDEAVAIVYAKLKSKWNSLIDDKKLHLIAEAAFQGTNAVSALATMGVDQDVLATMTEKELREDLGIAETDRLVKEFLASLTAAPTAKDKSQFAQTNAQNTLLAMSAGSKGDIMKRQLVGDIITLMRTELRRSKDVIAQMRTRLKVLNEGMPNKEEIAQIATDPAITWAETVTTNLWDQPSAVVEGTAVGNTIYQKDRNLWWKYDKRARAKKVSDYQFRSPLEWFSEVYAVYMLGKLDPGHPAYTLIPKADPNKPGTV